MPSQPISPKTFNSFGDLLKYLRRRSQLTQLELSIAVGYSEAQIGRLENNQRLPDLTAIKALFIRSLHIEDEPELIARLLELAQHARQEVAPLPGIAPYKGLMFFDEPDAGLFFGRESLTAHLARRVTDLALDGPVRFLAVVGASGSGKSSLVRAGLAVTLKQAGWGVRVITPTVEPLEQLDAQVNYSKVKSERVLILVDQFEEIFTLCRNEAGRAEFIRLLLELAQDDLRKISVVIALRADFYSHCAQYPLLRQAVAAKQEYIGQMTREDLRRAIEEPAKLDGWEFEPGLVDVLLQDVGADGMGQPEPGALPLLSHALLATWERRRGRIFTLDGYHASGGVRGAIAETAESVFTDQLNGEQQKLARDVFLRLTELGEGTEDTRRRATLNELVRQSHEATQLRAVLNTLAEARLITLNEDSAEVAHEALIREWGRLNEWLNQDRDGLRLLRHLTESVREWEARKRDAGELYRGARLAQIREWAPENVDRLNEGERAFIQASVEQEQHVALEQEAQRERELEAAQKLTQEQEQRAEEQIRAAQQLRRRAVLLTGALMLALVLAGFALFFNGQSARNEQTALVRELSASAINNLAVDPERSVLLALQAININTKNGQPVLIEAQDALHRSVTSMRILASLRDHDSSLWSVGVSRDGTKLVTVGMDGNAKVWDVATRKILSTLPTNITDNLTGIGAVFNADGTQVLTVSSGNTATLWNLATGKALGVFKGHLAAVSSVAISPDGKTFATASDDMTIKLWDAETGNELETLKGHEGDILVLAFGADGKTIYAGSDGDGYAIAWEIATGKELFRFSGQGSVSGVDAIAASPDGKLLATGEFDTTVRVWDATSGLPLLTLFGHSSQVEGVAFSADSKYLASASEDGTVKLWDAETGKALLTLSGHTSGVLGVAFSPDGNQLYTDSRDGTVKIWDISPTAGGDWLNLAGHTDRVYSVAYRPDGKQLASLSFDGTLKIWDAVNGRELQTIKTPGALVSGNVGGVSYSPDGKRLAFSDDKVVRIVDAISGAEMFSLAPADSTTMDVRFSPDGKRLAVASANGTIGIYDSENGKMVLEFRASTAGILRIAFSPDGKRIASANQDGDNVWDTTTGKQLVNYHGHGSGIRSSGVAFSPDGKWIATTDNDATIEIWDSETGSEIFTLTGHTGPTFSVAFSPDGQYLASSSVDRTVKVWKLPKVGYQVPEPLTLYGNSGAVYQVAFSPDGARIVSVGRDQIVHVYELKIEDLVILAKARLTRELTSNECQKYLHVEVCPVMP